MKSRSNRRTSIQKGFRKIYILIAAGLILAAGAVLLTMYLTGFFYNRRDVQVKVSTAGAEIAALSKDTKIVKSDMLSRTLSLLRDQTKTSPFVVSWYVLPGSISSVTSLESEYITAQDQVNLLRCYVARGNKNSAQALENAIAKYFISDNGYLVPARKISEISSFKIPQPVFPAKADHEELPAMSAYSMEATIGYLRALLEYYQKWGQLSDWSRIENLAAILYSADAAFSEDLTITALATPTPIGLNPDTTPAADGQISPADTVTTITLASLDLEVFRILSSTDSKYQPMYDKALAILSGAMISDGLPLFAVGYTQSSAGYAFYNGDKAQVDLALSLKVALHLAEAGETPQKALLWIKEQLYNEGTLYQDYDLLSGQASSNVESVESYGILLQIARVTNDSELYSKALGCLEGHLATNTASAARSAIFRQLDNARVAVYAKDNLQALLGV